MDPGSPVLEELGGFLDLFGSQDGKQSMDLDGGLSAGVGALGMPDADEERFGLNLGPALGRPAGQDLLSSALRSQADAGAVLALTVTDKDIRPTHLQQPTASAAAPMPCSTAAAPAAQFTIRPMPARKSVAHKSSSAAAAAKAVKPEPAADQQQKQQKHKKQQQQQLVLEQMQEEADAAAFDSDSTEPSSAHGGGKRRRRIRNAKQQELNRLAQQRYRERRKQKYSTLQDTVEELSTRVGQLTTLEAANSELCQRNQHLELVVKDQSAQLQAQKDTITRQAQQLQTQALQLSSQAKQLHAQVTVIHQQDKTLQELRSQLAAANDSSSSGNNGAAAGPAAAAAGAGSSSDADQLSDQVALAVRAVLTGVSSMASVSFPSPAAKDAPQQMQQMVVQLPDALLAQIRSCCREVALHLKKSDVKEQPHAISVPCC